MASFAIPVSLYMTQSVHSIEPEASLQAAADRLSELRIGSLAVTKGQELLGVLSMTDLLGVGRLQAGRLPEAKLLTLPQRSVAELMTREVVTVRPSETIERVCEVMLEKRIHRVFVVEEGRLRGVLSTKDVMTALWHKRVNRPISELMSSPVYTIRASEPVSLATDRLEKAKVSGLVVVDDGLPVGVFAQTEALASQNEERTASVEDVMNPAILALAPSIKIFRAASQAASMNVRRIVVLEGRELVGIVTGLDFCRAASGAALG